MVNFYLNLYVKVISSLVFERVSFILDDRFAVPEFTSFASLVFSYVILLQLDHRISLFLLTMTSSKFIHPTSFLVFLSILFSCSFDEWNSEQLSTYVAFGFDFVSSALSHF